MYVDRKGLGKQQAESKHTTLCEKQVSALGSLSSRMKIQMVRLLVGIYKLSKLF